MYIIVCSCLTVMYIAVCTGLVKKYNQVMQRYYVQYLSNYDAVCLNSIIQVRLFSQRSEDVEDERNK